MGLKDRFTKAGDAMAQAQAQAQAAMAQAGMAGLPEIDMSQDAMAAQAAESQRLNKIHQAGIEAPAVIRAIRAVGSAGIGGGTPHEFDVTITPNGGAAYEATVQQSMLEAQMAGLSEGQGVTVKYDPDNPTVALITAW